MDDENHINDSLREVVDSLKSIQNTRVDTTKSILINTAVGVLGTIGGVITVYQLAQSQSERQYDLSKSHFEREISSLKKEVEVKDAMILQLISYATDDQGKAEKLAEALKANTPKQ